MKVFFDTEFTGLHNGTSLISIGLISDDDKEFYAEISDYNRDDPFINDWIKVNVLDKLICNQADFAERKHDGNYHYGNKSDIAQLLMEWFNQWDKVELVSDVCYYDMVLFNDLFGEHRRDMSHVSDACHDICEDIARYYNIDMQEAFDKSREGILDDLEPWVKRHVNGSKHNALYDAKVIRKIYCLLRGILGCDA